MDSGTPVGWPLRPHQISFDRSADGLYLPSEAHDQDKPTNVDVPRLLAMGRPTRAASPFDQIKLMVDEQSLGLAETGLDGVVSVVSQLPRADLLLKALAIGWRLNGRQSAGRRKRTYLQAAELLPTQVVDVAKNLIKTREYALFPEQHVLVLGRLIDQYSLADDARSVTDEGVAAMLMATAGSTNHQLDDLTDDGLLSYFVRSGGFHRSHDPILGLWRASWLLLEGTRRVGVGPGGLALDLRKTFETSTGLTIERGLDIAARVLTDFAFATADDGHPSIVIGETETIETYARTAGVATETVSAFLIRESEPMPQRPDWNVWERSYFERRPFVRVDDERFVPWSPNALDAWIANFAYHSLLAAAIADGQVKAFGGDWGRLTEAWALAEVERAVTLAGPSIRWEALGEESDGQDGKTSDVALRIGSDCVLFELTSSRFRAVTLRHGRTSDVLQDLEKTTLAKLRQVARVATLIRNALPLDGRPVEGRIWPVVVTDIPGPTMPAYTERVAQAWKAARPARGVEQPTVISWTEFDYCLELIAGGARLNDVLAARERDGFAGVDFGRYVHADSLLDSIQTKGRLAIWDSRAAEWQIIRDDGNRDPLP